MTRVIFSLNAHELSLTLKRTHVSFAYYLEIILMMLFEFPGISSNVATLRERLRTHKVSQKSSIFTLIIINSP